MRLEDAAFATLPNLVVLDLSDNSELEVYGRVFKGLENSLMELSMGNISLIQAPDLSLPNLRTLRIAHNELPSIPPELAANLTSLRVLDLSENDLTAVPLITHSLPNLRSLSLAGNPITSLTNTSLLGAADTLEYLDIAHLQLTMIEVWKSSLRVSCRLRILFIDWCTEQVPKPSVTSPLNLPRAHQFQHPTNSRRCRQCPRALDWSAST